MRIQVIKWFWVPWLVVGCSVAPIGNPDASSLKPTVLLISLDGFRADYLDKYSAPNLGELAKNGVRAEGLTPSFPSVTFPNHYSIVTGLYPEHHGIVANDIYDPDTEHRFKISDEQSVENPEWWLGEPIWVTAQKNHQRSGTVFWVGSQTEIGGVRPTYWLPYDKNLPRTQRIAKILEWLDLPEAQRPTLLTLYFEEVDSAGHAYGPDSEAVRVAVGKLDSAIGELMKEIKKRRVAAVTDVIVVSDHGMVKIEADHHIPLEAFLQGYQDNIRWVGGGSSVGVFPSKAANETELMTQLRGLSSHLKVYRKADLPSRFHYQASRRIPPILILADEGYSLEVSKHGHPTLGNHGYDNQLQSMRGIFLASGPDFRAGVTVPAFDNIQVYNLLCRLLRIPPAANDGSNDAWRQLGLRR